MRALFLLAFIALSAANLIAAQNSYGNKEEAELMNILQASLQNPSSFVEKVGDAVRLAEELNSKAFGTPSQTLKNAGEKLLGITIKISNIINVLKGVKENTAVQKQRSLISQLALEIITLRKTLAASYATPDRQNANALLQKVSKPVTKLLGLAQGLAK